MGVGFRDEKPPKEEEHMSQAAPIRTVEGIDLPPVGTWKLDTAHTSVEFVARHMLTKVRGRFSGFDGTIVVGEGPHDSSVQTTVQTATIESNQEMRDNHLRSADFLDVERFPTLAFTSTKVRPTGGDGLEIVGDLTIKDITREVVLKGEFLGWGPGPQGGTIMSFSAVTDINREDWGMTWNMAVETGGFLVSKKVGIEIEVEAILDEGAE
jgi:polyisoprenoid-binding protein YceI